MRKLSALILFCMAMQLSQAQTLLIGGSTGNGDFEAGTTGWTFVNGSQTNKWVVSNTPAAGTSGNALYVSASAAAPYVHAYNTAAPAYSYVYRDVAFLREQRVPGWYLTISAEVK